MLHILAFFCAVCAMCLLWNRRFEQALPVALLSAMGVLTALAMGRVLAWVDFLAWLLLAAILLLAVYALASKRISFGALGKRFLANVTTPGLLVFVLVMAYLLYATQPMVVNTNDDVVHWGLAPKSLWLFGGLVDGGQVLSTTFATYPPGLQVLQWWMLRFFGQWQESTLYLVLFATYGVFLLPLTAKLRWKHAWAIPLAAVAILALPFLGNYASYDYLGVDTSLALCFGYTLVQIWQSRQGDRFALAAASLGMCGLVLIKEVGLLFMVFAGVFLLLTRKCGKKELLCLLAPLLAFGAWKVFCQAMGLTGFHASGLSARIGELFSGTYQPPEGADGILPSLWNALTVCNLSTLPSVPFLSVQLPKLFWLAFLPVLLGLLGRWTKQKALMRVALFAAIVSVVFVLLQCVSFYTVFYYEVPVYVGERASNMVWLMERYLCPMLLGFGVLALWLVVDAFPKKLASAWKPLPTLALALSFFFLVFGIQWSHLLTMLLPDRYYQLDSALGTEGQVLMDHDWGTALEGYENAHVLVELEDGSDYIKNLRYAYAPARFEVPTPEASQSAEALRGFLLQKQMTHLIYFNDDSALYAPACELSEDGELYSWTLYEALRDGDAVTLSEF